MLWSIHIVSLVVNGSMGEAHHLTREERKLLIQTARQVLDENQLTNIQLVAGTGGNSTRETIELTKDAAEAGAQSAMVIAPGELRRALNWRRRAAAKG